MIRRGLRRLAAAALAGSLVLPAAAQGVHCGPREAILNRLDRVYGETRQSIGLTASGALIELYASRDTGTWTILQTTPNGLTCVIGSGGSFEWMAEGPDGEPA